VRVLVTGGAGFVGANVSISLGRRHPDWEITAFDNLRRRGSELNLVRLREADVRFVHGDVRQIGDLEDVGEVDAVVECSAEPSVLAGLDSGLDFLVQTNLFGAYNCLEVARRHGAVFVLLSTSRVYPVGPLSSLRLDEDETRYELADAQAIRGVSSEGVAEEFPLEGARTFYGTTKLAAELLVTEYAEAFGVPGIVNRCGVIAGPWQMGKVDQGVFTYWLLSHYFGRPLAYLGYGGSGKQVRDLLHVNDLVDLLEDQLQSPETWAGRTFNVGGGRPVSLSLLELTALCREITGRSVAVNGAPDEPRVGDVPVYISDCRRLFGHTDWRPQRRASEILADIFEWAQSNERAVREALEFG
jgi:CDP-paratose 2-epimerase